MSEIVFVVISIVITVAIILIAKLIDRVKFKGLTGSHKIVVVVCVLAIAGELVYLSTSFGLLVYVFEIIASIGVGLVVLGINMIATVITMEITTRTICDIRNRILLFDQ